MRFGEVASIPFIDFMNTEKSPGKVVGTGTFLWRTCTPATILSGRYGDHFFLYCDTSCVDIVRVNRSNTVCDLYILAY